MDSNTQAECQSYGPRTHLATVLSNRETNVVSRYILRNPPDGPVWIGLHDSRHNRAWTWTDGSIYYYRAWNKGEPNNLDWNEYCAELLDYMRYEKWNDNICRMKNAFICKYEL
ncbi:regenerating islet-derived protein 4-like [Alligator mississippiensis]|uniref:regenerating islet-derived protein 4-like n=1 Tax=Alligator mississippiensis TaxID=8496 RepID=UPI00287783F5|nr:regenerating islet-derived protein 4-like [Alligator mississippiensis]